MRWATEFPAIRSRGEPDERGEQGGGGQIGNAERVTHQVATWLQLRPDAIQRWQQLLGVPFQVEVDIDGGLAPVIEHRAGAAREAQGSALGLLQQIGAVDPALGRYLRATIRTGTFCSYTPDPRLRVECES